MGMYACTNIIKIHPLDKGLGHGCSCPPIKEKHSGSAELHGNESLGGRSSSSPKDSHHPAQLHVIIGINNKFTITLNQRVWVLLPIHSFLSSSRRRVGSRETRISRFFPGILFIALRWFGAVHLGPIGLICISSGSATIQQPGTHSSDSIKGY